MIRLRIVALFILLASQAIASDVVRVATFNVELNRDGPGLLLRDIERGKDPQIAAVIGVITDVKPDILAIQGFDWDHELIALGAFNARLKASGYGYEFLFARRPNSGLATDLDLDGDGRTGTPSDAQGFGAFSGQGGIAVLSRFPIDLDRVQDFSALLWRDFPQPLLPETAEGTPFPSFEARNIQRLSSTGHWTVPIQLPSGSDLTLMTFQAGPPVFDGPEDQNGKRNHDEVLFWRHMLDGVFGPTPKPPFVIAGGANQDPYDGDGLNTAIRSLLTHPKLQDPMPSSPGAQHAPDQGHAGPNALDTVDWEGPGRMRVDYILPSADLTIEDAGVFWPDADTPEHAMALQASRHRLVWVDLRLNQ